MKEKKRSKVLFEMLASNEGTLFISAFAYSLIVSIAPILIIAVLFIGSYIHEINPVISILSRYIPTDLIVPFVEYISISNAGSSNFLVLGSLLTLSIWMGSKAVYSFLLLSSNQDEIQTPTIYLRLLSLVYFIVLIVLVTLAIGVIGYFKLPGKILAIPLLTGFLIVFYSLVSFQYTRIRDVVWGAISAAILMTIVGRLFLIYANGYSNYESVYGPLSSLMILLISTWFLSYMMYFGYCLNVVLRNPDVQAKKKNRIIGAIDKK